jgi:hypothetical protein
MNKTSRWILKIHAVLLVILTVALTIAGFVGMNAGIGPFTWLHDIPMALVGLMQAYLLMMLIGVIGLEGETAAEILSGSGSLPSLPETGPIVFTRQGQARAFLNDESGRTQVTFDHLPGALEFVSEPSAKASAPAILTRHAELITWYGFGEVCARQAEAIAKARNVVRRGIVNLDLKIGLA